MDRTKIVGCERNMEAVFLHRDSSSRLRSLGSKQKAANAPSVTIKEKAAMTAGTDATLKKKESKINLNKTAVDNLPFATEKSFNVMDAKLTGFGVRVSTASKTYFVYTRIKGRSNDAGRYLEVRESIGRHGIIRFEDAKSKAKKILEDAAIGISPDDRQREAETLAKIETAKGVTLGDLFKEYLTWNKQLKESTKANYRTHIDCYLADWKDRPIREITSDDVLRRHALLSKKILLPPAPPPQRKSGKKPAEAAERRPRKERIRTNGPGVANATMKILRAVMNYALNNDKYSDIVKNNPVKLGKAWNRLKTRENLVTTDQLPAWLAAVQASEHPTARDALLLMLFTGVRSKTEAFRLKWSDIDWTSRIVNFHDTKNSSTLRLPMSTYVHDLLKNREKRKAAGSEYVFPSAEAKEGHVTDIRDELDKINKKAGITITPHDLRRTFMTYADDNLGISFLTIKALVNHESNSGTTSGSTDVTAGYIKVQMPQRREAMQRIADYILDKAKVKTRKLKKPPQ
jgi:integrase